MDVVASMDVTSRRAATQELWILQSPLGTVLRVTARGFELRLEENGQLSWSRPFPDARLLMAAANHGRAELVHSGWVVQQDDYHAPRHSARRRHA